MSVAFLSSSIQRETCAKEGDVEDVAEEKSCAGVHAEGLHRAEGCQQADVESQHICQRGDRDGHTGLLIRFC